MNDSTDFTRKITRVENISENSIIVTMDVRFLFTRIPDKKRIEASETSFKESNVLSNVIITFLHLILLSKNFAFNCQGKTNKQKQPTRGVHTHAKV